MILISEGKRDKEMFPSFKLGQYYWEILLSGSTTFNIDYMNHNIKFD